MEVHRTNFSVMPVALMAHTAPMGGTQAALVTPGVMLKVLFAKLGRVRAALDAQTEIPLLARFVIAVKRSLEETVRMAAPSTEQSRQATLDLVIDECSTAL